MSILSFVLSASFGAVVVLVAFVVLNRKKPDEVDKAEDVIRKIRRKP